MLLLALSHAYIPFVYNISKMGGTSSSRRHVRRRLSHSILLTLTPCLFCRLPFHCKYVKMAYSPLVRDDRPLTRCKIAQFVTFYYQTFDTDRAGLASLYVRLAHSCYER